MRVKKNFLEIYLLPSTRKTIIITCTGSFLQDSIFPQDWICRIYRKPILINPIRHRTPRNFCKIILHRCITIFSCKIHFFLAFLCRWLNQSAIRSLIFCNMTFPHDKAGSLHHFPSNFFKRSRPQMCHIYSIYHLQFCTQFFKAGQKHPCVLCNHRLISVFFYHLSTTFYKNCKQITLTIRIILFYELI